MMLKLSLTLLLAACGANPTPSPSSRRTEAPHDFAAELRAATKGPADDDAVCTYAVFSPGAPSRNADRDGLARVNLALRREGLPDVSLALTVVPLAAGVFFVVALNPALPAVRMALWPSVFPVDGRCVPTPGRNRLQTFRDR